MDKKADKETPKNSKNYHFLTCYFEEKFIYNSNFQTARKNFQ